MVAFASALAEGATEEHDGDSGEPAICIGARRLWRSSRSRDAQRGVARRVTSMRGSESRARPIPSLHLRERRFELG
jgi:hypothetical protein